MVLLRADDPSAKTTKPLQRTSLQGAADWSSGSSKPPQIEAELRHVLVKYGELTQICYDSFFGDRSFSEFGCNKYPPEALIVAAPVNKTTTKVSSYQAQVYLYANSGLDCSASKHRYWMGYVAVSAKDTGTGLRDVVLAWRGTVAPTEWVMDIQDKLIAYQEDVPDVLMAQGFRNMYMRSPSGVDAPQVQVRKALEDVYTKYKNEIGSLTVCGHSLGGALTQVCAFDIAYQGLNVRPDGNAVPVTAFTYAAPRVGDAGYVAKMNQMGVKVLRAQNFRDIVPKVPGISKEELEGVDLEDDGMEYLGSLNIVGKLLKPLWIEKMANRVNQYAEVGTKLEFDTHDYSDIIKTGPVKNAAHRNHNLEVLLHLIDPARDVALMNKGCDALKDRDDIPPSWNDTQPYKGMYVQLDGSWRKSAPYAEPQLAEAASEGNGKLLQ